jgi:hypothetical protein
LAAMRRASSAMGSWGAWPPSAGVLAFACGVSPDEGYRGRHDGLLCHLSALSAPLTGGHSGLAQHFGVGQKHGRVVA